MSAPVLAPAPTPTQVADDAIKSAKPRNGMNIAYVIVAIGRVDRSGNIVEELHRINSDDHTIHAAVVKEVAKKAALKEEGKLIGFEPTGEHRLTVDVEYYE